MITRRSFIIGSAAFLSISYMGEAEAVEVKPKTSIWMELKGGAKIGVIKELDVPDDESNPIKGEIKIARFDRLRLAEVFNRGFLHYLSQHKPFDIVVEDEFDNGEIVHTRLSNVWLTKNSDYTYKSDDFIIICRGAFDSQRGAEFEVEEIIYNDYQSLHPA